MIREAPMRICETCLKKNYQTHAMHEPEARIHKDNHPDHEVIVVGNDEPWAEE